MGMMVYPIHSMLVIHRSISSADFSSPLGWSSLISRFKNMVYKILMLKSYIFLEIKRIKIDFKAELLSRSSLRKKFKVKQ